MSAAGPLTPERYPEFMALAKEQARKSQSEGGIPIGAAIVHIPTGKVLAVGHNSRVQLNSNIHHGEMNALESLGRVKEGLLAECAMFTTLSPCIMCSATCVLYKFRLVIMAENHNFVGGEDFLRSHGVEVVNLADEDMREVMTKWIHSPEGSIWWEDIGEIPPGTSKAD